MKKILALLLATVLLLSLAACGGGGEAAPEETDPLPTKEVVTFLDPKPSQRPDYTLNNPTEQQLREVHIKVRD